MMTAMKEVVDLIESLNGRKFVLPIIKTHAICKQDFLKVIH